MSLRYSPISSVPPGGVRTLTFECYNRVLPTEVLVIENCSVETNLPNILTISDLALYKNQSLIFVVTVDSAFSGTTYLTVKIAGDLGTKDTYSVELPLVGELTG